MRKRKDDCPCRTCPKRRVIPTGLRYLACERRLQDLTCERMLAWLNRYDASDRRLIELISGFEVVER